METQSGISQLSLVIPLLDQQETWGDCIKAARMGAESAGVVGNEIIVIDIGSTDDTARIAEDQGARVVAVSVKGNGAGLLGAVRVLTVASVLIVLGLFGQSYASRAGILTPNLRLDLALDVDQLQFGLGLGLRWSKLGQFCISIASC